MTTLKHLLLGAVLALTFAINAETARADTVELFMQSRACFACPPPGPFFPTATFRDLSFSGSTFSALLTAPPSTPVTVSLGTFTLGRATDIYTTNFILQLGLRPEFTSPGVFYYFDATVTVGGGAAFFNFDNRPERIVFAIGGVPPEMFSRLLVANIEVDDVTIGEGGQAQLTARITPLQVINPPQAVPEPATMLLLGTGLAGAGVLSRRRHRR